MAGVKALSKIQVGLETTIGAAVAATRIMRYMGRLDDTRETVFPEEDIGILGGADRAYTPKLGGAIQLSGEATFEDIPYILAGGVQNVTSGDTTGKYSYSYVMPTTAGSIADPKTLTIEAGDNQQAEEMEGCFVSKFTLTGVGGGAVMMTADYIGRQVANTTFTTPLSPPAIEEILFSKGKIYADTVGGTIGTTPLTNTWLGFNLSVDTGYRPVYTADGSIYWSFVKQIAPEITGSFTFEHDSFGVAEKTAWRANTIRQFRMIFTGSALTDPAQTYAVKTALFDFCALIEKVDPIGDQDGNNIITANFRGRYNSTAALFFEAIIANNNSAL